MAFLNSSFLILTLLPLLACPAIAGKRRRNELNEVLAA